MLSRILDEIWPKVIPTSEGRKEWKTKCFDSELFLPSDDWHWLGGDFLIPSDEFFPTSLGCVLYINKLQQGQSHGSPRNTQIHQDSSREYSLDPSLYVTSLHITMASSRNKAKYRRWSLNWMGIIAQREEEARLDNRDKGITLRSRLKINGSSKKQKIAEQSEFSNWKKTLKLGWEIPVSCWNVGAVDGSRGYWQTVQTAEFTFLGLGCITPSPSPIQ